MNKSNCEICDFNNPKTTVTAVIIRDNRVLVLKRNGEPFKGQWDLVGGFMNADETPEESLRREVKEELNVDCRQLDFIGYFPGTYQWKDKKFSILSIVYLVEIDMEIKLSRENSEYKWLPIGENEEIAFDSGKHIYREIIDKFKIDLPKVGELVGQLDKSAKVKEYNIYRGILSGYLHTQKINNELIGMGWIFPRQTMLRKQAVVEDMIVDEDQRGKGFGKKLIDSLINWAKDNKVEIIELTSNPARIAANELYKKVGFILHPTNHYLKNINDKVL